MRFPPPTHPGITLSVRSVGGAQNGLSVSARQRRLASAVRFRRLLRPSTKESTTFRFLRAWLRAALVCSCACGWLSCVPAGRMGSHKGDRCRSSIEIRPYSWCSSRVSGFASRLPVPVASRLVSVSEPSCSCPFPADLGAPAGTAGRPRCGRDRISTSGRGRGWAHPATRAIDSVTLGQLLLCSVFGTDVRFRTKVSVLLAVLSFGPPRVAEPWGRSPSLRSVAADTELAQDVASDGWSLPPSWRA